MSYSSVECPYCGKDVEINHDDGYGYEENEIFEQECEYCENVFVYTTEISFFHDAKKADCKNGGEHVYKRTHTYPPEFTTLRCTMCGDEKPLDYNLKK